MLKEHHVGGDKPSSERQVWNVFTHVESRLQIIITCHVYTKGQFGVEPVGGEEGKERMTG
jgi:hypothetical protein